MNICRKCILPETFPGITFNDDSICNHCRREESAVEKAPERKIKYRKRLDQLIESVKGGDSVYDAIVAYSGGKDSTYTLKLLRDRYNLRLLALTFDNHFISQTAWENINKVTDKLEIDCIRFKPPWPLVKTLFSRAAKEDIFPVPTLLRASAICTACIGIIKSIVLKIALEMSIPLVGFGWSPGQAPIQSAIMKTNPALIRKTQSAIKKAYPYEVIQGMKQYFIPEVYYEIYKASGWQAPMDTDTNSTNCLLNAFANQCHIERHGFHPYVWEIANMVRQGVMKRDEGIEKIYTEQNQQIVKYAKERLGL